MPHSRERSRSKDQLQSEADVRKRFAACKKIEKKKFDKAETGWDVVYEKVFTVQTPSNTQNDRVFATVKSKSECAC